jgi:hypothetical protein
MKGEWNEFLAAIPGFLLERGMPLAQIAQAEQLEVIFGLGVGFGLALLPIAAGWIFSFAMEGILGGTG